MPAITPNPELSYPEWAGGAPPDSLEPGSVHVWRACLDDHRAYADCLISSLSPDEVARASRFHFELDRIRYSLARGLLRFLIGRYLGQHPSAVSFAYTPRGKPYLPGPEALAFNLSHAHGMALYAFGRNSELGIDLERQNPELNVGTIVRNFFTPGEARYVLHSAPDERSERFFFLWSRKEAYVKARAEGFYLPLDELDISADSTMDGFDVQSFSAYPQFAAALVAKPRPSEVLFFDFDSLGFDR